MTTIKISRLDPYPSDITERQWDLLVEQFPMLLDTLESRRLLNAILYKFHTNTVWAFLPRDFPHPKDVEDFYSIIRFSGLLGEVVSYLASNYQIPAVLIGNMRNKNISIDIIHTEYEVEYQESIRTR